MTENFQRTMLVVFVAALAVCIALGLYITGDLKSASQNSAMSEAEAVAIGDDDGLNVALAQTDGPVLAWMPIVPLWQIPQNWWNYPRWTPPTPTQPTVPTPTATARPTNSPQPTATATAKPTNPAVPTATATAKPTNTPTPTATAKPTNTPTASPTPVTNNGAALQQYSLELHNSARAANGIAPLVLDDKLNTAAMGHAQDMAKYNYFSHTGRDGSQPWDRMTRAGATWSAAGENIGAGSGYGTTLEGIKRMIQANFNSMMAETPPNDGHRKNILNGGYHKLGVGIASDANGKTYWVCDFTN